MKYIVYCAIHQKSLVIETMFSLFALMKTASDFSDVRIIILTDQYFDFSLLFKRYPIAQKVIIIEYISAKTVIRWTDNFDYRFFIKINAINYVLQKYKANTIFLDSDTFMIRDILPLFDKIRNNEFLLFSQYITLKELSQMESHRKITDRYELHKNHMIINNGEFTIPFSYYYYNTGVIGIGYHNAHYLEEVMQLCKRIYCDCKVIIAEEFAFSYIFQKYGQIHTCDYYLFHYVFAKWSSLFLGKSLSLDRFIYKEFNLFFKKHKIVAQDLPIITYETLPHYIYFVDSYLLKTNALLRDYKYLGGANGYVDMIVKNEKRLKKFIYEYERNKLRRKMGQSGIDNT